jgi:hypothetical protein
MLESRDREDKSNVLFSSYVCVLHITKVLFIGHKEVSEWTKIMTIHSLVGVIGKGKDMMDIH